MKAAALALSLLLSLLASCRPATPHVHCAATLNGRCIRCGLSCPNGQAHEVTP